MKFDKYIGFDLHQATTVVAVLDAEGKVVMGNDCRDRSGGNNSIATKLERAAACNVGGNDTGAMDVRRRARVCERSHRVRSATKQTVG